VKKKQELEGRGAAHNRAGERTVAVERDEEGGEEPMWVGASSERERRRCNA